MKWKFFSFALAALLFVGLSPTTSSAQVGISIGIAPPPIPIYTQPYPPGPGYIWTPGYWAYDSGYYWVPGAWIFPPRVGFLWTPGYWAFDGTNYFFNQGYWGPTVGFYGGINYGWGYGGVGYYGGRWEGNTFYYNRAVTRVNTTVINNTYVDRQGVSNTGNRASFNGPGGTTAKPTAQQEAAAKAEHIPPTSAQQSRLEAAKNDPDLHVANNKGKPKAEAIKAFDRNNGTAQAEAGKGKRNAGEGAGNSAFGQKQGDATTRTKGSQNNAYGKAQSAEAHAKSKGHANKVATTHHPSRQAQVTPHRQQSMLVQRGGAGSSTHGKGQSAQSNNRKKKYENQRPGQ